MVQKRWECSWVGEAWHNLTDFFLLSKKKTPTTPKIQFIRLEPEWEPRPSSERFCLFVSETCSTQSQRQTPTPISTPQTSAPQPLAVPRGKPRKSPRRAQTCPRGASGGPQSPAPACQPRVAENKQSGSERPREGRSRQQRQGRNGGPSLPGSS